MLFHRKRLKVLQIKYKLALLVQPSMHKPFYPHSEPIRYLRDGVEVEDDEEVGLVVVVVGSVVVVVVLLMEGNEEGLPLMVGGGVDKLMLVVTKDMLVIGVTLIDIVRFIELISTVEDGPMLVALWLFITVTFMLDELSFCMTGLGRGDVVRFTSATVDVSGTRVQSQGNVS